MIKPDKLGYTEKQVRELLWRKFAYWMRGQTYAIGDDEKARYYSWDVERYIGKSDPKIYD